MTDTTTAADPRRLPFAEFVALIAVMFSMMAFSIDAMLPALPQIADELSPARPNDVQLIIGVFFFASGIGQLVAGPLSDAIGRRPVILGGIAVYIVGSILAWGAPTLGLILAMRFMQGLGLSALRTVAMALVRDLYVGRMMARVMSLSMMLFVLVPAIAPLAGQWIMDAWGWRSIFLSFIVFAGFVTTWYGLRQPETLDRAARRAMTWASYKSALAMVTANRQTMGYTAALALGFAPLIALISSIRLIFGDSFDLGEEFPYYFAAIAVVSGSASFINASLVVRLGMRRLVENAFAVQLVATLVAIGIWMLVPDARFVLFLAWVVLLFFTIGFTFGNLNALAMEPMGAIAGFAAAIIGAVSTVASAIIVLPVTTSYDGTPVPLMLGTAGFALLALVVVKTNPKGD